jgi:septum formation protein
MSGLPLILASGSPRRRELLREMGMEFEVITAGVEELDAGSAPGLAPAELAIANAKLKAGAVARLQPGRWILGADTVVALDGRVFGKPASREEAGDFLRALSGRTHEVITGGVLRGPDGGEDVFHEISRVTFQPLSDEVIARYLGAVQVLDKAGGYALQERGEWIVASVEGSRANVIGLPVEKLSGLFRARGLI